MKTILLCCSAVIIIAFALVIGGAMPPAEPAHAETTASEALQEPQKIETDKQPSEIEKPVSVPETKPERVLTDRQSLMQQAGVPESDWTSLEKIINDESGWCATKWEGEIGYCPEYHGVPATGGYGLCQSTPGVKMASMGEGWETNWVKQIQWCYNYTLGYGSAANAIEFKYCTGYCYSTRTKSTVYKYTPWF